MQYVIFHGSFGSTDENWFPWLKKVLEEKGNLVVLEQFPCEDYDIMKEKSFICNKQNLTNWLDCFEKNVLPKLIQNEKIVFIGHSIAPAFILRVVEKFKIKLEKAIFVSPFLNFKSEELWQYTLVNSTFLEAPFDFEKINELIKSSVVFYGDDDPYITNKEDFIEFAKMLNSKIICIHNGGHLSSRFGFTEFPQILDEVI